MSPQYAFRGKDGVPSTQGAGRTSFGLEEFVIAWKRHESARSMLKPKKRSNLGAQNDLVLLIGCMKKNEMTRICKSAVSNSELAARRVVYEEILRPSSWTIVKACVCLAGKTAQIGI